MQNTTHNYYDLIFYISNRASVNLNYLYNALRQHELYKTKELPMPLTMEWLIKELHLKIDQIDFKKLKADVIPFIKSEESIAIWSAGYFYDKVNKMM